MKYLRVSVDGELCSNYNLLEGDAWLYSRHHTTRFTSIYFNWGSGKLHLDYYGCTDPHKLAAAHKLIMRPEVVLVAHNAAFEKYTFENILGWKIPASKWICTQAKAGYYHLPQSLDKLAQALNLPVLKDMGKGKKALTELMIADPHGKHLTPEDKPQEFADLYEYNFTDTEVCRLADAKLPDLPADERRVWNLHMDINQRGIPIDWFLVQAARQVIETETAELDAETWMITSGQVSSTRQVKELGKYLGLQSVSQQALDAYEENLSLDFNDPATADAARLIDIRRQVGLSSLAKFAAFDNSMDTDRRVRSCFWYYGAHPGRWTGIGSQPQNLVHQFDQVMCDALEESDITFVKTFYEKPLIALQGAVRGAVYAGEDKTFLGVDLKQIEARAAAWIGDDQETLALYRAGKDVYCATASKLYGRDITKANLLERDTGKRIELLCQFGGGVGGLEKTFVKNGVDIEALTAGVEVASFERSDSAGALKWYYNHEGTLPEDQALALDVLKQRWRKSHKSIVSKWDELERGFVAGIYDDGRIKISKTDKGSRVVTLASGRQLFYRDVHCGRGDITYAGRWGKEHTYGASIFQNIVQATDRDAICFYMLDAERIAPIILHCHDEFVVEVKDTALAKVRKELEKSFLVFPAWATGLPIAFETWEGKRYAK